MNCTTSSFLEHRAITDCFKSLRESDKVTVLQNSVRGNRYFGRLSAVSSAIITDDGYMVFVKRSETVASDANLWTCGVNEGMKCSDSLNNGLSIPHNTTIRGLKEEFGIDLPRELHTKVSIWGTVLNRSSYEWYFFGLIDLRGCGKHYSHEEFEQRWRIGCVKDKFEAEMVHSIPFDQKSIIDYVKDKSKNKKMTEYGIALSLLTSLLFENSS